MTTEEDQMFLNILDSVRDLNVSEDEKTEIIMEKLARLYLEQINAKKFKKDPKIWEMVKYIIPEEFL